MNKYWNSVSVPTLATFEDKQSSCDDGLRRSSSIFVVGLFLNNLFESNQCLEAKGLAQRYNWNGKAKQCDTDILVAKNYDQQKLIHLIVSIYNGIPEHFDILRCHSAISEHDLKTFMQRVLLIPRLYTILEVNCLSFELQEVRCIYRMFVSYKREYAKE